MVRSIRWRLQIWYAVVLLAVVVSFAGMLYLQAHAARLREVDSNLEGAAHYLDAHLRAFPSSELEGAYYEPPFHEDGRPEGKPRKGDGRGGSGKGGGGPGKGGGGPGKHGPPKPRKNLEQLHAELVIPNAFAGPAGEDVEDRPYFIVWRKDGTVLKASTLSASIFPTASALAFPSVGFEARLAQQGLNRQATQLGPNGSRILVGKSIRKERAELSRLAWQLAGSSVVVLTLGFLGGWLTSSRITRPLAAISAKATSISASNLSERIDTQAVDNELLDLAGVLNEMFARLEAEFDRQQRFTADASHELRTPLTILQTHVEFALARRRSEEEYGETLRTCLDMALRMRALVNGLLTLARADAGRLVVERVRVDLVELVHESLAQHADQADHAEVKLSAAAPTGPVLVLGDAVCLGQVIANLLANALRHTPAGGQVRLAVRAEEGRAVLTVADTGCGIPEEDQPRVFERFYRVDPARSRASGGCGLGLAICKCVIEAHGGTIQLVSRVHHGSLFTVCLPLLDEKA